MERKYHILLHNLGIYGRKVFETLPEPLVGRDGGNVDEYNVYEIAMLKLETHFGDKINVVLERHKFFKRVQAKGESVLNYVAVLRGLSKLCEFGNLTDSLIRDQMVRCTNNHRIQEKLLIRNPNLLEAVEIAKGIELTEMCMKEMCNPDNAVVAELRSARTGEDILKNSLSKTDKIKIPQEKIRLRCYRCASSNHLANSVECQAKSSICRICG